MRAYLPNSCTLNIFDLNQYLQRDRYNTFIMSVRHGILILSDVAD